MFVLFRDPEGAVAFDLDSALRTIRREHPRWTVEPVDAHGWRVGRYDSTPVVVRWQRHRSVAEEAVEMASGLPTPESRALAAAADQRLEVSWDLTRDTDVVPETADLVIALALSLARLTRGIALAGGNRVVPSEQELESLDAYSLLFPTRS